MTDVTPLKFVFLTLPESDRPILNIQAADTVDFQRFELTRDQLFALNAQTADALLKGENVMSVDVTANYHRGNQRSVEAHEATKPRKNADYIRILAALRLQPAGFTCDEAEQVLGMSHQTCSARFADMKRKGWLITRGKRKTRSNCWADVHYEAPAQ